ncbi:ATP-binding cassette domain-containing protein [Enterobacteriaceae endosymbiont of Donacia cincticornis]|uniref:ATP-binding cassette domain-containing protein n=1 Tax=Enterobacteriaceae endosymbiont of Donacia cincticornis TaxID=2675773 RepID=UPI0014491BD8|nr:ATP-binding cassette domain-containing protein [Enterobacteriaceae endosymbiont of Donacia cincticornis]QJC36294.1 ATP-binding cassette domain-containing protein [Enterobacteriaceae endosymbiont of Donacia cincticornis]
MNIYKEKKILFWLKKNSFLAKKILMVSYFLNFINILILIIKNLVLAKIIEFFFLEVNKKYIFYYYNIICLCLIINSLLSFLIDKYNFLYSQKIKIFIRKKILRKLTSQYFNYFKKQALGSDLSLIINNIENLHDYYHQYIPQYFTVQISSLITLITIFAINWIFGIIIIIISVLIIFFIILIGDKTINKNKKNFKILSVLSGIFFDRLKGIETIRIFNFQKIEINKMILFIEELRKKNFEILKIVFLTFTILDFFSSITLAFVIMYFSFSYLHIINIGFYHKNIGILHSFFILIIISEYFQNFNNLGKLYHIKSKAIGAVNNILKLLSNKSIILNTKKNFFLKQIKKLTIHANNLVIKNNKGRILIGPLSFKIFSGTNIVITGPNGAGKSTLFNVFLGITPYEGSLKINNIEFNKINLYSWYKYISCVQQNPQLFATTIKKNLFFSTKLDNIKINNILKRINIINFLKKLPDKLNTIINRENICLSIGQMQKIIIARALIKNYMLLLLDEPIANIDINSQNDIIKTIKENLSISKISITITHKIDQINYYNEIWHMKNGKIIMKSFNKNLYKKENLFLKRVF